MIKIRVTPAGSHGNWYVQQKKWWGWKNIYQATIPTYIEKYIEDLKMFRDVKIIR
jgi:hypothetical protein